jgi:hypothetical protein
MFRFVQGNRDGHLTPSDYPPAFRGLMQKAGLIKGLLRSWYISQNATHCSGVVDGLECQAAF